MNIKNALKICRTARGYSQKELAERAEMSPSYVSRIEKGQRDISIATLEKLAEALEVPLEIILFMGADRDKLKVLSADLADELAKASLDLLMIKKAS